VGYDILFQLYYTKLYYTILYDTIYIYEKYYVIISEIYEILNAIKYAIVNK